MFTIPLLIGVASVRAAESADNKAADKPVPHWEESGWKLVERFCIECHNPDFQEAEVDLSILRDAAAAPANAVMWNRVLQMVRFGAMPPDDAELPTEAERRSLIDAIERTIYQNDCDLRPKAGRVTARRLNRAEYSNTIRDLFGIKFNVTDAFPSDEVGGGFDNNADVLSMPPMLLEKYIEAAEQISTQVILDPSDLTSVDQERSGDGIGVVGESVTESFYGRILKDDAFAWVEFDLAQSGKYRIRVSGGAWNKERSPQHYAIYDRQGTPLYAGKFEKTSEGDSHSATFSRDLEAGKHFFVIAPLESLPDGFDDDKPESLGTFPDIDRLDDKAIAAGREQFGKPLTVDRDTRSDDLGLMVRRVSIQGPTEFSKSQYPASHFAIIKRVPESRDGRYRNVDDAAAECLKPLMEKVFRGPVDQETVDRYAELVEQATRRGMSFHRGMQVAITGLLVSPQFLFRVELPHEKAKPDAAGGYRLSSVQLASRLSYFLWSSTPDETLLRLAREGNLDNDKELLRQVDRMLADPKSKSLATEFAAQWLGLRNLAGIQRDGERFPEFDASLLSSMNGETEQLFTYMLRNNRPVGELLNADYTFINEPLAKFYGLPWDATGDSSGEMNGYRKVSLADTPRRGVLTHGSVLTLTSYPTRTSPVQRGKWILENVLGTPAPDPPPNVPELEATKAPEGASVREQLALHRANPACASCHKVMDQLGFGFEQFDAIGRYRTDKKIDASGELPGGRIFEGGEQLANILRTTESTRFAATVSEKLLGFALGRELSPDDRCVTDKIVTDNQANDYRLADLVKSVVLSRPFQYFEPESLPNKEPAK
ncbi:MAG: DUF1592 domain-containing protein [Planctomycetaceae bacterium]